MKHLGCPRGACQAVQPRQGDLAVEHSAGVGWIVFSFEEEKPIVKKSVEG